jgi:hypothetical protein
VKLSAKWLTALAALALLVVAVVGMSPRSASAATGAVFAANEWSKLTNESPAPSGYLTASSVYATFSTATRLINSTGVGAVVGTANADRIKIVVTDADLNTTSTRHDDADALPLTLAGGGFSFLAATAIGSTQTFTLTVPADQIATAVLSDIKLVDRTAAKTAGTDAVVGTADDVFTAISSSLLEVTAKFDGDGIVAPYVTVRRNSGSTAVAFDIRFPTSAVNTTTAVAGCAATTLADGCIRVKTDSTPLGKIVLANETGLNTGRFVGYVSLLEGAGAGIEANSAAAGDALALIKVNNGPVTIEYADGTTIRTATVLIDTSAPAVTLTGPAHNAATQNRLPAFSGSVSETGAGLKLVQQVVSSVNTGPAGSFALAIDRVDDAADAAKILSPAGAIQGTGNAAEAVSLGTVADAQATLAFTYTPLTALPNTTIAVPDHKVDWQVRVSDLAGNIGFSDSDTTSTTAGTPVTGGFQSHVVKIDQKIPEFLANVGGCSPTTPVVAPAVACSNATGKVYDSLTKADSITATSGSGLKVTFNDSVTNVESSDFSVTLSTGGTHVPSAVTVNGAVVYLTIGATIPSNATATVAVVGPIADLASNGTSTGSVTASDGLPPKLTVTLSGGTGTGTGAESAAQLTKSTIKATIVSDESLSAAPTVTTSAVSGAVQNGPLAALAEGTTFSYTVPGGLATDGDKAIVVTATDPNGNVATSGAVATKSYKLDSALVAPVLTPTAGSTISLKKPFITVDFSADASTVTIAEITLDGVNVTAQLVAASGNKKYFIVPATDLTNAEHTVTIPATKVSDAAGTNNAAAITFKFTVADRKTFDLTLFAGWNLVSLPSDPVDPDINSVLTNKQVDQLVAYDATNAANPWRIATRDAKSGAWTSTTETPLNAVRSGRGYWLHTNNFEAAKVLLVGPTEPAAGSPPAVVSIPLAKGWNLVGVVDGGRVQTEGASGAGLLRGAVAVTRADYLGGVNAQRVYRYNSTTLRFEEVAGATQLLTGDGLWTYVTPNADGTVAAITP